MRALQLLCLTALLGAAAAQGNDDRDEWENFPDGPLTPKQLFEHCKEKAPSWHPCFEKAGEQNKLPPDLDLNGPQTCIIGGGTISYCLPEAAVTPPAPSSPLGRYHALRPRALWSPDPYDLLTGRYSRSATDPTF